MKLIKIQKHNFLQYASILPESLLHDNYEIFVCAKDEIPCGVIALEKTGAYLGIIWLWVASEKRRQKIGSLLLLKAYQFAQQYQYDAITIAYDPDEPWAAILEYMLSQLDFDLYISPYTKYCITAEMLSTSPLLRNTKLKKDNSTRTHALASLSSKDYLTIQLQCKKDNNYLLSNIDYSRADTEKTRLIFYKDRLIGLTLINYTNTPGEYELAMVYINPAYQNYGLTLFRETALELLKDTSTFSVLKYTCVNNTGVWLTNTLIGDMPKTIKRMCHGILEMPILRKE